MIEVLSVTSEVYPLVKTGGLADVAGALPGALARQKVAMRTLVPGYPAVLAALEDAGEVHRFDDLFGGPARLLAGRAKGLALIVIEAAHLYQREGGPYVGPDGRDYDDNWSRFAALSLAAAEIGRGVVPRYRPDVLHVHDWQAGLTPAYVKFGPPCDVKSVVTVHNIAFQGQFGGDIFSRLRLPPGAFSLDGVEYYGGVGYLKAGLQCADAITTVSPTYALEIRTPEFGMGLEGLINSRSQVVRGILNGIDTGVWDPGTDPYLPVNYRTSNVHLRARNKTVLNERFGLERGEGPVFGLVSRLTWQKGIDILAECMDGLVAQGGRLAVLGSGDAALHASIAAAAARHPGRVGFVSSYDEPLSHLVQGGADAILVPSRFEPCGLTQLYGLRYGCVPVVARVGGLSDTVIDANQAGLDAGAATGVQFQPVTPTALADAIRRTVTLFNQPKVWARMQRRGMKSDVSWDASAARYKDLYNEILGRQPDDDSDD